MLIYSAYIYQHHFHKKKKKTACYSDQEINMQTRFFFSVFPAQKKKKKNSMHIPTSFSHKKLHAIQTKKLTCKLDFFFSSFPAQKNSMHIPTSFSHKKLHVIHTKKLTCKLDFFFLVFQFRKTACIYQHNSDTKTACYSNQ